MVIGVIKGLALGLFLVLLLGLQGGLLVVVRHFILRIWLWRTRVFPWNALRFLDNARACRILLRQAGGGYSFRHRLLLDYFADLDMVTPLAQAPVQTKV
jgi:eukaryotic-like serine/threonine-protein kinase